VLQLVVSDNASHDDTLTRLRALAHPCLEVIAQTENIGMVGNWNACLARATGEWFLLLSDDDLVADDFHAHAIEAMTAAGDADLIVMRCRVVNELTGQIDENPPPTSQGGLVSFTDVLLPAWLRQEFVLPLAGVVFRTETLRASGGFSNSMPFAADIATWLPIAMRGTMAFWPHTKISYIMHQGMTTRSFSLDTLMADLFAVHQLVLSEIGSTPIPPERKMVLRRLASKYVPKSFGAFMMFASRAGTPKRELVSVWRKYSGAMPFGGVSALSLGAIIVPARLVNIVGFPYRLGARCCMYLRRRRAQG
jgi:hypothetical protein